MKKNVRSGGADITRVGELHELVTEAAIAEIKRLREAGEPIPPALLTSALRICEGSGVSATLNNNTEVEELASIVAGLNLNRNPVITSFRP
jgi:hypothetical protein